MQLTLSDGQNFNTLNLEDYKDSYADELKLLVKVDNEYKNLDFQNLLDSNGEIYVSKSENLAGTYEYVQFDLIGPESEFFTIILPTIDVYQTEDSMLTLFKYCSENLVENFESVLEYELIEFDYVFDEDDDTLHVNPMQVAFTEFDGMRIEIKLEGGTILDPQNKPMQDQLDILLS